MNSEKRQLEKSSCLFNIFIVKCQRNGGKNMIYSLLTFISWGVADLFYKKGNYTKERYNDIKTGIIVGIIMGIHAIWYMILNNVNMNLTEIISYLPVSLCYIFSMVIGYKALRYIELSIASPVQNTSRSNNFITSFNLF